MEDDPCLLLLYSIVCLALKSIFVIGTDDENQRKIIESLRLAVKAYIENMIGTEFGGGQKRSYFYGHDFPKAVDEFKVMHYYNHEFMC